LYEFFLNPKDFIDLFFFHFYVSGKNLMNYVMLAVAPRCVGTVATSNQLLPAVFLSIGLKDLPVFADKT